MNQVKLSKMQENVLSVLCSGFTQVEASKYLGMSRSAINKIALYLIAKNIVRKKDSKYNYKIQYELLEPNNVGIDIILINKEDLKNGHMRYCVNCGQRFITTKLKQKYCNSLCGGEMRRGPNSSRWTGGEQFTPYCWLYNASLKERVKAFFDYKCALCGKDERENYDRKGHLHKLAVHHVNYNRQASTSESNFRERLGCIE